MKRILKTHANNHKGSHIQTGMFKTKKKETKTKAENKIKHGKL